MRIVRILPLTIGLALATVAPGTPASADFVFAFTGSTNYTDSISVNHWGRKSRVGVAPREVADEAPARSRRASGRQHSRSEERVRRAERRDRSSGAHRHARRSIDEAEFRDELPRSHRRRGRTQVASLGSGLGGGSGVASYYWQPQRVASGGWFNPNAMTAAHKTLPFGTRVRVTHASNGRSVVVRINDRGPYVRGRTLDLSRAAASVIGMIGQGVARIRMEILGR